MTPDLLTLLKSHVHSLVTDAAVIAQNIEATNAMERDIVAAIEPRMRQAALRADYREFCNSCRRDLDGLPTFNEWKDCCHD